MNGGRRSEFALLTLLAGVAGLSYELLYARLLGQYLGEVFHVRGAVLTVMLIGIACGALLTPRFRGRLWIIQCGLGVFALLLAGAHAVGFETIVTHLVPLTASGPVVTLLVVLAVLAAPALAIGLSVPLFAERIEREGGYAQAYGLYNLGAAVSILAIEYFVLRTVGLTATLALAGCVDVVVGARLRRLESVASGSRETPLSAKSVGDRPQRAHLAFLVGAGVLSSTYQMFALKQAQVFWGPFSETFALHLFIVIGAIGVASLALARWRVSFGNWLIVIACGLPIAMLLPSLLIPLYPGVIEGVTGLPRALWMVGFFCATFGPPFVLIAGTLPTFWGSHPAERGWRALTANSFGNAAGFAGYMLLVHPQFDDVEIAVGIAGGFGVLALLHSRRPIVGLSLVATLCLAATFDGRIMKLSFRDLYSQQTYLGATERGDQLQTLRVFDTTLVYRVEPGGAASATVDGHRTLRVRRGEGNFAELLHGTLPLAYLRQRGDALSLGVGTGISTGALAESFARVTAVEISPAVLQALPLFEDYNFHVGGREDVELILGDGMTFLYRDTRKYDAIVSTVDGPFYRSSAKLYSREFFALARERLHPGGVYAFWLDQAYSPLVNRTIIATARRVFAECHVAALNGGYVQIVCGDEPLVWEPLGTLSPALAVALERGLPEFGPRHPLLYFGTTGLTRRPGDVPINTLDRPVLEFAKTLHVRSGEPLFSVLGAGIESAPGGRRLSPAEVSSRCALLRHTGGGAPPGCTQLQAPQL